MRRRRLMHVVRGFGTGGTEMMCLRLTRHWQKRFDQCVVSWSGAPNTLEAEFRGIANVTLEMAPAGLGNVARGAWLHTLIRRDAPDALLIHIFGHPHVIAAFAARSAGVRAIAAMAGNPPPQTVGQRRHWSAILAASRFLRCPVVSCSKAVEREFNNLGAGMPVGSAPIPNGIDDDAIAAAVDTARNVRSKSRPVIGMVARLNEIKDHATLLHAFAYLRGRHVEAELLLVGDGPLRRQLEEQAKRLGISMQTRFVGERVDVLDLLGGIDVYAFSTTRAEGFGIALIEAMAAGIPIVATDVPACREVLGGGAAGLLVPPGNAAAFAYALSELLQNDARRCRLVEAARDRVKREYSIDVCARRWEQVLFPASEPANAMEVRCAS
ncbi:glycosyltransferase [Hyphomicrobium sp. MC1]|uniref:glycosyltransferase n=1 Tax=Hyphomicrobium sp. (strain MC1) TaxID=717785 RepID=UPI000213DD4E|nr:glycosyltransferase [Hyphomicrobium sp. MC1]CCB66354.1 Glycosyl transferase group 1 [Hyphomicrobium sp. MC1]